MAKQIDADSGYFVPTLNSMGYMTRTVDDPFTKEFLDFCKSVKGPVLEIGAAFGVATLEALKLGVQVYCNDLDPRHLEVVKDQATESQRNNLLLLPGEFPEKIDLNENCLDAILAIRIVHFLNGETLNDGFKKMHRWLKPGGRVFIATETPWMRNFKKLGHQFQTRIDSKMPWPGWINTREFESGDHAAQLPEFMHLMVPETLSQFALQAGFRVLKCEYFARPKFPTTIQLDGRESVGLVAEKTI